MITNLPSKNDGNHYPLNYEGMLIDQHYYSIASKVNSRFILFGEDCLHLESLYSLQDKSYA
jgi:hypothetical protein